MARRRKSVSALTNFREELEAFCARPFIADRNKRRSITMGQKAMAHAKLFPEAKQTQGRRGDFSGKPEKLSTGHWQNLVSQARAVLHYSPTLADEVRDGFALNKAFETIDGPNGRAAGVAFLFRATPKISVL
jgi:hypothetical protein